MADQRSTQSRGWRHLYGRARWKHPVHGVRARQLREHPLCAMCESAGLITAAAICDHIDPKSKETEATFFEGPFQSLCKTHHDATKQRIEARGYEPGCDVSGRPIDAQHPWNA